MRALFVTGQFTKDFQKIPDGMHDTVDGVTQMLRKNPLDKTLTTRKLHGMSDNVWRVRIGIYRLVYIFDKTSITLLRIRHRKDVYKHI